VCPSVDLSEHTGVPGVHDRDVMVVLNQTTY
jgi:hypothetical protein